MSLMRDAIGVLLAGGQGERLWPLTRDRAKPAVPFGGVYRIIDITLSNCINSDLRRVFALTQYKALSLNRHIRRGWSLLLGLGEFIEVLPPQMRVSTNWYLGTADAVYQNIYSIGSEQSRYVIILSGDHIYKMNYQKMLQQHVDSGGDATVATFETTPQEAAARFGVVETDANWRINGFEEKPESPKRSHLHPDIVNASMGVYIFNTQLLIPALLADAEDPNSKHDFGRDILPRIISKYRVYAYNFIDENKVGAQYWRDVGTIEAYYEANMDLRDAKPHLNLYNPYWPLRTAYFNQPPAKFVFNEVARRGVAVHSIISEGCIISGGAVRNSILGRSVFVHSYSEIDDSVVMDYCSIGRHARIRRAIIDKNVHIAEGEVIGYDLEQDRKRFTVTDSGIVVIPKAPKRDGTFH
jgi:glucose-1-phosphate adenylyltransferase